MKTPKTGNKPSMTPDPSKKAMTGRKSMPAVGEHASGYQITPDAIPAPKQKLSGKK